MAREDVDRTSEYFNQRAARYAFSIKTFPFARVLDLVPYVYALSDYQRVNGINLSDLKVLDAFGGTGFLHHALGNSGICMHVADCSSGMLSLGGTPIGHDQWHHSSDYFSDLSYSMKGEFDAVFSHGGLHHVVVDSKGVVDTVKSEEAQRLVIENLSLCLKPGGFLIIGDIPDNGAPVKCAGRDVPPCLPGKVKSLLGEAHSDRLNKLGVRLEDASLFNASASIKREYGAEVDHDVPRYFFDNFVCKDTPLGHIAHFLAPERLNQFASSVGLVRDWVIDYRGSWLFENMQQAGWYFREKFSYGNSSLPGEDPESELAVAQYVQRQLGCRVTSDGLISVNWGVVYSCFRKA